MKKYKLLRKITYEQGDIIDIPRFWGIINHNGYNGTFTITLIPFNLLFRWCENIYYRVKRGKG